MTGEAERAWQLRMSYPQAARQLAEGVAEQAPARVVRAYLHWREGDAGAALELISGVEPLLRAAPEPLWLARAINVKGAVLLNVGQAQPALACYQEQLQLAQQVGDPEMEGLAHNDTGVLLIWDDPARARLRFQMAYDLFLDAGEGHEAGLGLSALNLSVAYRELGDPERSDALLALAGPLILRARAWPYWVGVVSQQGLRLAEAGQLREARTLFQDAEVSQPALPTDSRNFMRFFQAKMEALHGDPEGAQALLDALGPWVKSRHDMLDDYLEVRAQALERLGDWADAYRTMRELMTAVRQRYERERATQLKTLELLHRTEEAHRTAETLRAHAAALHALHQQVNHLSLTDDLTGLHNRRHFVQWSEARLRDGLSLALAFVDIDHFKQVNDGCGHEVGDRVVRQVADLLHGYADPEDLVARLGGDEFVVARVAEEGGPLLRRMEQVRAVCEGRAWPEDTGDLHVTLSIGVTWTRETLTEGLRRADQAMYRAKQTGRNRVSLLPPDVPGQAPEG